MTSRAMHSNPGRDRGTQTALWESEERFRSVFDNVPVGIAIIGLDFKIRQVNPIRNDCDGILQAVGTDGNRFRQAKGANAGSTTQMIVFIKDLSNSFLPAGMFQCP